MRIEKVTRLTARRYPNMLIGIWMVINNGVIINAFSTKRAALEWVGSRNV